MQLEKEPKKLPLEFTKNGYFYKQLKRNEFACVYEQISNDVVIAYEVAVIQVANHSYEKFNISVGDESYPSNNMWGLYGFTFGCYNDWEKALRLANNKFDELLTRKKCN